MCGRDFLIDIRIVAVWARCTGKCVAGASGESEFAAGCQAEDLLRECAASGSCGEIIIQEEGKMKTHVFISGQDGYHTYRIPALLVTQAGTLLAFARGGARGAGITGSRFAGEAVGGRWGDVV